MQFEIESKVTTKQTITLDAPAFYSALGSNYFLTEKNLFRVDSNGVSAWKNGDYAFTIHIQTLAQYGRKINQQEYESEFDKQIKCLTEQYQSSTAMMIDPKDQEQPQEQATEGTKNADVQDTEGEGLGALVD